MLRSSFWAAVASCVAIAVSVRAEINPCEKLKLSYESPTYWNRQAEPGSTRYIAQCVHESDPNVVACIAIATQKDTGTTQVGMRMYSVDGQRLKSYTNGEEFYLDEHANGKLILLDSYISVSRNTGKNWFHAAIDYKISGSSGNWSNFTYNAINKTAQYQVYHAENTTSWFWNVEWELKQDDRFNCQSL